MEARSNFTLSHGKSVAIGMAIVARSASDAVTRDAIEEILDIFGLPRDTACTAEELYVSALSDKKRTGGTVNLIVPRAIGDCAIVPTPVEEILAFIEKGL